MRRKEAGFIAAQAAVFVGVIALVSLPLQFSNNTQVSTSSTVGAASIPPQQPPVNQNSTDPNCAEYGSVGGGTLFCVCAWAGTAKMIGFDTELRVAISPSPKLGQSICLYATVTLGSPAPPMMIFTVTNSTGMVVYQTYCHSTGSTVATCSTSWDTSKSYQGINATPGGYALFLSTVPVLNQTMIQGIPFTLG